MRVLISGGGVGGMTLAYWLRRRGHTPVIVERAPRGRSGGYGFDFFGTSHDVARRMGLVEQLTPRRMPVDGFAFVDEAGRVTARMDGRLRDKIIKAPYLALMHTTLEEVLEDAVRDDVEMRFERSIAEVRQGSNVNVTFTDGVQESYDLLVGADGVHSTTRELVFGPEEKFSRYLGYYLASYPVQDHYGIGAERLHYTEPGRQVVVYRTGEPGQLIALFLFKTPYMGKVDRAQRLDVLREHYAGMGWITPQLLAEAPESIFMDSMSQIVMPKWHNGRVVLVGDACGCMTLVSAQGVSMAMGGAYVLAEALQDFDRYESRMRPEVERRQRNARSFLRALAPGTQVGVAAQRLISKFVLRDAFSGVLRNSFGAESILSGKG